MADLDDAGAARRHLHPSDPVKADPATSGRPPVRLGAAHYRDIVESAYDFGILTTDLEGRITSWNSGAERLLGWTEEEAVGADARMIFTSEDKANHAPERERRTTVKCGRSEDERWHLRKDGSVFWGSGLMMRLEDDASGEHIGFLKIFRDQTLQHQAQERLCESEALARALFESSADCVKIIDLDGRLHSMNGSGMCLMEMDDFSSFAGMEWASLWPEELRVEVQRAADDARNGRTGRFYGYCPTVKGTPKWWDVQISAIAGPDGKPTMLLSVSRDVTTRERGQQALGESEAHFRNMADHAPVIMWVTDATGACTYLNPRWYEFTGQTENEAEGLGWLEATHPDDKAEAERVFLEANAQQAPFRVEYRLRTADGSYRWAIDAASPRFSEGRFVGYVGSVIDIDERRSVEDALRRTSSLLSAVMEAVPGVVYAKDRDGRIIAANRGTVELVGRSMDEIVGRTDAELLDDADQAAAIMANDRRIMDENRPEAIEEHVSYPDGTAATWLSTKAPFRDPDGLVIGLIGSSLDISERKRAEDRLRRSEARLRFLGEMDDALRASRDAPAAMLTAAELLARKLHTSRCAYADVNADNNQFVIRADYTAPGVASSAGTYSLDLFGPRAAQDMRGGRTLVIRDVSEELAPDEGRETFHSIGIEAIVCCPLVKEDRLVAMMAVHQIDPRDWQDEEIDLIQTTVERCRAHVERISAEARLRESEERLRLATESAEIGFWDVDVINDVLIWPARVKAMFGISPDVQVTMQDFYNGLHPGDHQRTIAAYAAAADPARRELYDIEYRTIGKEDGQIRWVAAKGRGVFDDNDRCVRMIGVALDISRRKQDEERLRELNEDLERRVEEAVAERAKAEEQLRQSQKMEAVGQLTGGIAHDFNNLLTGVIGSLDMMQRRLAKGETDRIERYATTAMTAANRAAALTHRLLAFARRQPLDPKPVNANRLVTGMEELLRRTIGEAVSLEIVTADGLWRTLCDPHQLESAVLNLAINARDAMPEGGKLTIKTCNARLDDAHAARQREVKPGQYICICVTDTGTGMTPEVIAKAFEPFFTTKPIGQGTGLGLSMIYGFARQSEGYARIYSEVGQGSTIKLYLPKYDGESEEPDADRAELTEAHRSEDGEVVLVVEDELAVRDLVIDVLQDLGYKAIEASDGPTGLKILQSDLKLDLLISDVGLPGLNGRQLADAARKHRPELKVLFMTGYAENATIANGFLEPGMQMITKPFAIEALATRIRDMIEQD